MQGLSLADKDVAVDVKLYSHRWRRWLSPEPRNMDSNRASQDQDPEPDQDQDLPDAFPGLLSAEDADNSSQIEVGYTLAHHLTVIQREICVDYLRGADLSRTSIWSVDLSRSSVRSIALSGNLLRSEDLSGNFLRTYFSRTELCRCG